MDAGGWIGDGPPLEQAQQVAGAEQQGRIKQVSVARHRLELAGQHRQLLVTNLLFAFVRGRLSTSALGGAVAVAGIALVGSALHFGTLDVGPTWPTVLGGFPRVLFSFFAGMLLQRLRKTSSRALPSWLVLAILIVLLLPRVPVAAMLPYELVMVFVVFPVLVHLGAGATERWPRMGTLLGDASYAAYAIHFPIVQVLAIAVRHVGLTDSVPLRIASVGGILVLAWLLARFYDEPLRAAIDRRRRERTVGK